MNSNLPNVVLPGHFNPKTDKWCDYKEQLLCALDVAGAAHDTARARSLFLSQCGKDTYSLIASLLVPLRPTSASFEDIINVLDKFFEPEVNEILQAGKFHKRVQLHQESVQEFIGSISLLAAKCNFADLKRQLRDRLVLGVRDERLRRELLKTKDLTYTGAVQYCLNYQATFPDLYPEASTSVQTPHHESDQMEIDKIQSINCKHCARVHKPNERCPFSKAQCYYCKRHGHIAPACNKKQGRVHQTEDKCSCDSKSDHEDMNGIYVCAENYHAPITTNVVINGAKLLMEIDFGASRSIIAEDTFKKLWSNPPPLHSTNVKLVTWTRAPLKVLGLAHVRVVLGDKEAQCELVVVAGGGPTLLGRNWFDKLGLQLVGVCWSEDKIAMWKKEYPNLFKEGLGEYTGPLVSLHVRPGSAPRCMKARPVPFPLRQQVEDELHQMIKDGVLSPIKYSKWATPLRIVKKDDGSLRICGDYRSTVNASIDVDTYPLPTSTEAFVKLSGGSVFSKLDLKQAYTQLKVDEDTAMLLTLNTPIGLMKMNRLAFGVSAAPGIFQRVMSTALADMDGVACLLDDVAVTGRNMEEHNKRLDAVLRKLQDMGFRLNINKCIFASRSITFLGHMLDAEGLHPSPDKVNEIKAKPAPTNKETLRAFLGLYNFYEKFLPDKATLLEPLYRLLEAKTRWAWGDREQAAFNKAKSLLSSDCTLVGYDLNKHLLLICDSSDYGLGAILAHVMKDRSERPVMMASRTLQPHERRYGQIDKEALAIMFGLDKYHQFLAGRKFCIITDHKPLVGLFNPDKPIPDQISPRMLRWSLKLNGYSYSIKYRPGKSIGNADALSRWTEPDTSSTRVDTDCLGDVLLLAEQPVGWNLDVKVIAAETKKDTVLQRVSFNVLHGWPRSNKDPELQPYWIRREALSHNKECLLWCNRVIIPASLHQKVLRLLHAPHAGIVQTKAYARGYLWWAGIDKAIERVVAECEDCQLVRNNPPKDPQVWVIPDKPWSRVHVDFAGPFQGKTFLLLIDSYSKWIEAEIVPSMSSESIITILRRIFASQGLPDVLVSDNGRTFTSEDFNLFLKRNHIRHLFTPPYHPASNGQIERAVQTLKNKLKKMATCNMPWKEKLAKALYALRTVPNSCTNKTPAEMLNGRKYRTAVSILHPESTPSRAEEQLERAAQRPCARTFREHQPVLVRMYTPGLKWEKGTVEMVEGPSTYLVRTEDGELHRRHADQIISRATSQSMATPTCDQQPPGFGSQSSTTSEPIEIPPPELWPDIIGIPNDYCVHLQLYKDLKERQKNGQTKASLSLQQYLGFEAGFTLDKESNTLAILCEDVVPVLAFDTREILIQWRVKVQHNLGSSKEFTAVIISAPNSIRPGPARLHACGPRLALCGNRPPEVLALWDVKLLRRFGIVDKRFCVEGGSRCGRGEGLFVFAAEGGRELTDLLNMYSHDAQSRLSIASRTGSVLEKRYSDTSSMDDGFPSLRSASPWAAGSQTMHCISDLDSSLEEDKLRRPTSLPRCSSCIGKISHLARSSVGTPGSLMSPVWTMDCITEKRADSDRASIYSRSSGSASEYSVPRTCLDKSVDSKRGSPVCCPSIPAKTGACPCWQPKPCCCRKFAGPYENYDVPKTPMPLIQEHPIDGDTKSLYDTPKKLKCLLNQTCNCSEAKNQTDTVNNETYSNYVNVTPVPEKPARVHTCNYANVDLSATLEKFESSLQILRSAGFSQEELDALEDIPENDDDISTATTNTVHPTECCNEHSNYMQMEPLEISSSSNSNKNCSDNISRISHVSDPTQHSESDTISTRRSSSADFTKRHYDDFQCFTPTVLRKASKNECINEGIPIINEPEAPKEKAPEKSENTFVTRFRDAVKIRRSSSVPSKSDKNRDSSSSNDSGVSTGSLKHHKGDFEFEMPVTNGKSSKKYFKNKPIRRALTPVHGPFVKSNSSDPLRNLTFHFEEVATMTKSNSCDVDTLTRRKNRNDADMTARHSQVTNNTSSGASDTSDYMESLSVSSFSSCDVADRHVTRPRSGKEYASIDRATLASVCDVTTA